VSGHKGLVGYGIRELTARELATVCPIRPPQPPLLSTSNANPILTENFWLRVITVGCYYYDTTHSQWMSSGVELVNDMVMDLHLKYAHCRSTHLTEFAGGFLVLPSSINFEYVFANASFDRNPVIYLTVIILTCLYVLFAIWARYMDKKDAKRVGVSLLEDNPPYASYFYEVIVFTGSRSDSATDSKVSIICFLLLIEKP
jgi:hypothetical protein